MPAIPQSTRSSIILRLLDHAGKHWLQLTKVQARYHGSFAYITGVLPGGEQIPLFRLRYGGSAHSFGFAIYSPARDRYEDALLLTGLPIGSPQEALDTACTVHLTGLGHQPGDQPPTNLRGHPLSSQTVADHPLFREQSYHALSRQDAAQWTDLGTYRANDQALWSQSDGPVAAPVSIWAFEVHRGRALAWLLFVVSSRWVTVLRLAPRVQATRTRRRWLTGLRKP